MKHIGIIAERDELPWTMFTINKNLLIPQIYRTDTTKALCATTDMERYEYPNTILVQGKSNLVEFGLLHSVCTEDSERRPLMIYLPERPTMMSMGWRVVLETRKK